MGLTLVMAIKRRCYQSGVGTRPGNMFWSYQQPQGSAGTIRAVHRHEQIVSCGKLFRVASVYCDGFAGHAASGMKQQGPQGHA